MALLDTPVRDVGSIQLPRWGRVVPADDVVPWQVVESNMPDKSTRTCHTYRDQRQPSGTSWVLGNRCPVLSLNQRPLWRTRGWVRGTPAASRRVAR